MSHEVRMKEAKRPKKFKQTKKKDRAFDLRHITSCWRKTEIPNTFTGNDWSGQR